MSAAETTGLLRNASQPAARASAWNFCDVSAVTAMMAQSWVRSSARSRRATLKPSMPGSMRSSTTAWGPNCMAFPMPAAPSLASSTMKPAAASSAA